jgi:hypothetical protein
LPPPAVGLLGSVSGRGSGVLGRGASLGRGTGRDSSVPSRGYGVPGRGAGHGRGAAYDAILTCAQLLDSVVLRVELVSLLACFYNFLMWKCWFQPVGTIRVPRRS